MQLLFVEWLKLKKYKTFWVLISLFSGLYILWNYGVNSSMVKMGSSPISFITTSYTFPAVWTNMGYVFSWFEIFLSILVIIVITNEFTFKTHRQQIIDGLHRLDFINAKALLILSITILSTLFYFLLGIIFGYANGGTQPWLGIEKVSFVFLYSLNYLSFAGLLALYFKRSGITIVMLFAYLLLETILSKLINFQLGTNYGNMLPLQSSDELLPFPALQTLSSMMPSQQAEIPTYQYALASIVYIILYYWMARKRILSSDL